MYIISTREIKDGAWTYFKAEDDQPRFFGIVDPAKLNPGDLRDLGDPPGAVETIVAEAKKLMPSSPMVLVFAHGYNNTVPTAVSTAIEIGTALDARQVMPAMGALCWSTDGKLENYLQDRSDARASDLVVSRALLQFAGHPDIASGAVAFNLLSHSMGNYLMDVACEAMGTHQPLPLRLFRNSILVAADINRDDLNTGQEGDLRCRLSDRVTFYYDGWDGTLAIAEFLLHRQRFGQLGPHHWDELYPNTIGVSCTDVIRAHTHDPIEGAWDVGVNIHSGYFGEPKFYDDLAQVLQGISPAEITTRRQPAGSPTNAYRLQ